MVTRALTAPRPCAPLAPNTDGLVERRHLDLDTCLEDLRRVSQAAHQLHVEDLADHLMRHDGQAVDDDVALVVVRFRSEG